MVTWQPISKPALLERIERGRSAMPDRTRRLWGAILVEPEKWHQHPYGDAGGGFWVVALMGRTVIWYNDIEEGFNRSAYSVYGVIDDYWCNQDELNVTLEYLANALVSGRDLALITKN